MAPTGKFLLMGSGEFEPWSEEVERVALQGREAAVAILPTASAAEGDKTFDRWARMGLEHFERMGVPATVVPLKTREDAEREDVARALDEAGMIFFSGGNPKKLAAAIGDTPFWGAMQAAMDRGAVFAGCSAGAMVASQSRDRGSARGLGVGWVFGLGLVPNVSFGVHWDKVRYIPLVPRLVVSRTPAGSWFVGLEERTAILGDGERWTVFGLGGASVRRAGSTRVYRAGDSFETPGS